MDKPNIPGTIFICTILLLIVVYAINRATDMNWILFGKVFGTIAVIALITSILAIGGDKARE